MSIADTIRDKLTARFAPSTLNVVDESAQHSGHMHAAAAGETHFRVTIVADAFAGVSRVERQRQIYSVLTEELAGPVHALALKVLSPAEAASRESP